MDTVTLSPPRVSAGRVHERAEEEILSPRSAAARRVACYLRTIGLMDPQRIAVMTADAVGHAEARDGDDEEELPGVAMAEITYSVSRWLDALRDTVPEAESADDGILLWRLRESPRVHPDTFLQDDIPSECRAGFQDGPLVVVPEEMPGEMHPQPIGGPPRVATIGAWRRLPRLIKKILKNSR